MPLPTAPFDATKSIFAGLSVIQLKLLPQLTGVTAATSVISKAGHTLVADQLVQYVAGTGFTGLVAGTNYFVRDVVAGVSFGLSATKGGAAIAVGTSTVGVFAPVSVFEVSDLSDSPEQETKYLDRPDAQGVLRHARGVETKAFEKWMFGLDEVKRLLEVFSGSLRGRKNATCTLWIPDPDQTAGTVALKSEADFSVVVSRDGDLKFGGQEFSKATIKVESLKSGNVTWTADAAA